MVTLFSVNPLFLSPLETVCNSALPAKKLIPLLHPRTLSPSFVWKYAAPGSMTQSIELVGFEQSKFRSLLTSLKNSPRVLSVTLGGMAVAAVCLAIYTFCSSHSSSQNSSDSVHSLKFLITPPDFMDRLPEDAIRLPASNPSLSMQLPPLVPSSIEKIGEFSIISKIEDPDRLPIQLELNSGDLRGEILRIYQNWKEVNKEESTPLTPEEESRLQTTLNWFETLYPLLPVPSAELGEMLIRILTFDYHSLRPLIRHDDYDFFSQLLDQSRIMILEHLLSLTVLVSSHGNSPREIADQLTDEFLTGMGRVTPFYERQVETWVPTVVREANPFLGRPAVVRQVREIGSPSEIDVAHLRRARQARIEDLASRLRSEGLASEAVRFIDFLAQPTSL